MKVDDAERDNHDMPQAGWNDPSIHDEREAAGGLRDEDEPCQNASHRITEAAQVAPEPWRNVLIVIKTVQGVHQDDDRDA
jgi:hypothetical protein